jgi:molybdopterin-guanine dinucleotide biosynthesis protein A
VCGWTCIQLRRNAGTAAGILKEMKYLEDFGTAVILCGGKSSRMGFDKSTIKIKDKLLVEIIAERLKKLFKDIILVSDNAEKFHTSEYKVVKDIIPDLGPLGAIYSALKNSSSKYVFIIACDMPVININFIKYMMLQIKTNNSDGAVCYNSNFIEPMYAFYSIDMLNTIESEIELGNYKLLNIIKKNKVHYIEDKIVRKYCKDISIFTNLNYKKDLDILEKIFPEGKDE